ncbi:MAG: hypothetical protein KF716_27735 [Anaerolineae bacterium]|nr:hypothetical protein [Anaerolineae bacterium]
MVTNNVILAPAEIDKIFDEGFLQPNESEFQAVLKSARSVEVDYIRSLIKTNHVRVVIGEPQCLALGELIQDAANPLLDLTLNLENYAYNLVHFALSFQPEPNVSVEWARFTLNLFALGSDLPVIAYDMCPREIYSDIETESEYSLGLDFKFGALNATIPTAMRKIRFTRQEAQLLAFGLLRPDPNWEFEASHQKSVRGIRTLYTIVRMPRESVGLRIATDITATVKYHSLGISFASQYKTTRGKANMFLSIDGKR